MSKENSWEYRLPHESIKAFAYFNTYLQLGLNRSLAKVRKTHNNDISLPQLNTYSSKYHWVQRANEKDEYDLKLKNQRLKKEQEEYFKSRQNALKQYDKANDAVLVELLIDLGLLINPSTGEKKRNKKVSSVSVANSLKNLTDANVNNTKLALRYLGLPETIRDTQDITVDGNLNTENKTIQTNTVYNVDKTSKEFFEKQLEYIDKMIQKSKENNATQNNQRND